MPRHHFDTFDMQLQLELDMCLVCEKVFGGEGPTMYCKMAMFSKRRFLKTEKLKNKFQFDRINNLF